MSAGRVFWVVSVLMALSPPLGWSQNGTVMSFASPQIEVDDAALQRARERIGSKREPFYTYWQRAQADVQKARSLQPAPYRGRDSLAFHGVAQEQGIAARLLAYQWRLAGDEAAGAKAVSILEAWSGTSPMPGTDFDPAVRFPNSGMDVARSMLPLVVAYDLLNDHPALTAEKRDQIEIWFRRLSEVVQEGIRRWEENDDFGGQEFQNHHASHVLGLATFGAALNDESLIILAAGSPDNSKDFKELVAGLILMPGNDPHGGLRGKPLHAGEMQDRYRTNSGAGLIYCHLSLTLMLYTAEVLTRVTGQDYLNWEAPGGETLRLPATFYSDFFRLKNVGLHGGYYQRDQQMFGNSDPFLGLFEVTLSHWPDVPNLKAMVRSMNRSETPRSWLVYYGLPLLTHGVDAP